MTTLRTTLDQLATDFAHQVLHAIRTASLEEILRESGNGGRARGVVSSAGRAPRGRGGRLGRRTAQDISTMVDKIVSLLKSNSDGMRAEQIRAKLGIQAKELPRPLAEGLAKKRLVKKGQKRATTYFAR